MSDDRALPLVAIVGRPNVGKSTLYNRLVGGRPALVEDTPGVTRDRRYGVADFAGRAFRVVDTGGMDPTAEVGALMAGVHRQAARAIDEAEVIIFVTDARDGLTPVDREVAQLLRRANVPVLVVANKVDSAKQEALAAEVYELGLGDVFALSATHGRGTRELLDAILEVLPGGPAAPEAEADDDDDDTADDPELTDSPTVATPADAEAAHAVRLAFVGRPNVGKSSLVNRLLGEERVLVHDQPGTTTDPVDTPFELLGRPYVLVDTAGIRRRARIEEPTEKISVSMALGQIERADVAVLVIDATEGPAEQDAKIAGAIEDAGRAVVIAVNKDDLLGSGRSLDAAAKKLREQVRDVLPFVAFARICFVSAKTGHGVPELIEAAQAAYDEHGRRVGTAELNKFFAEVCETHPPPTFRGRSVRIYYLAQVGSHPPTFVLWANRPELVHHGYRRFLMNQLRQRFGFEGSPVRIATRRRGKGS
jgi:GTP-binding protein